MKSRSKKEWFAMFGFLLAKINEVVIGEIGEIIEIYAELAYFWNFT